MSHSDGYNADMTNEQRQKLRDIFPEVFSEGKIDFDRLRATLGDEVELSEKYGLNWKGKSGVFAKIQEKTVSTLRPQLEESVDWDTTQNMFIEGDNLEALKVLHKAYYGKIKMIYIDPPYNTGNDFVYNDDFKKTRREQALEDGTLDEEGNATRNDGLRVNTGGHKHSNWLDMMYPRLFLARNLLSQDGVIFVSIDDNEVHNLRMMMNEIFGEENFIAQIIWEKRYGRSNDAKLFAYNTDYILLYRRSESLKQLREPRTKEQELIYTNPDKDPRGPWTSVSFVSQRTLAERKNLAYKIQNPYTKEEISHSTNAWKYNHEKYIQLLEDNRLYWGKDGKQRYPRIKRFLNELGEGMVPVSLWKQQETGTGDLGTKEVDDLVGKHIFDHPKPTTLLRRILGIGTSSTENDIVVDFFGGSGSLAHAVQLMNSEDGGNRRWITVQLPEQTDKKSEAHKAGYKSIAEIARERIRRAGAKISKDFANQIAERKTPLDLGFRSYVISASNFKKWNELISDPEEIKQQTLDSLNPLEGGVNDGDLITEILLKRGILPLVEIEEHIDFVFVPSEKLAISLVSSMDEQLFSHMIAKSPSRIILLDQAFKDDVNLKTNLILQAEKQNIVVETL